MKNIFVAVILATPTLGYSPSYAAQAIPIFDPTTFSFVASGQKASLIIHNNDSYAIRWTAQVVKWDHDESGTDSYQETAEIVTQPSFVDLDGPSEKTMQVSAKAIQQKDVEGAYRLIMTSNELTKDRVGVTYSFGMPIFVPPANPVMSHSITLRATSQNELEVSIANEGNVHSFLTSIEVAGETDEERQVFSISQAGWYILAHHKRKYILGLSGNDCQKVTKVFVTASFREGSVERKTEPMQLKCATTSTSTAFKKFDSQISPVTGGH